MLIAQRRLMFGKQLCTVTLEKALEKIHANSGALAVSPVNFVIVKLSYNLVQRR